MTQTTVYCSLF